MKMEDNNKNVTVTLTYLEAEQLLNLIEEYKLKVAQPKIAKQLSEKLDEYINT